MLSNPFLQVTLLLLALDIPQGLPGKEGAPLSRKSEQSERQTQGGGRQGHIAPLTQHPGTHPKQQWAAAPLPKSGYGGDGCRCAVMGERVACKMRAST